MNTGSGSWCLTLSPWQQMRQVLWEGDSTDSFPMRSASLRAPPLGKAGKESKKETLPGNSMGADLPLTVLLGFFSPAARVAFAKAGEIVITLW